MVDETFDLSYTGLIAPGGDSERARERLAAVFKLSDKGAERLFTGKPVIVKRNVDRATAEQYEKIFVRAGAILTITRVAGGELMETAATADRPLEPPRTQGIDTAHLTLAPAPDPVDLEPPTTTAFPEMDLSHLSLVPEGDWTLADCEPPPTPIPELDTSYLVLEPLPVDSEPGSDLRTDAKPR